MVCGACHGLDGKGMMAGPMKMAPAYADSKLVSAESSEIMAIAVMKGIKKEDAKFLQIMMPLEAALDDAALAGVLTYVRNTYGGKTDLVTADQAKAWREKYKGITAPVSRAELEKLGDRRSSEVILSRNSGGNTGVLPFQAPLLRRRVATTWRLALQLPVASR